MRTRWLAGLFASVIIGGCSSSSNNPADAGKDGPKDTAATDTPVDMAAGDTPAGDTTPSNDVVSGDAPDGGLDVPPGSTTQKLSMTIIVTDQIGGDGGLEVAPSDAGAGDADGGGDSGDAGAVTTPSVDPNLVNPWGLAINPTGPIWVADNHTGLSTVYNAAGQVMSLVVTVPVGDGGTAPSAPTGQVFNSVTTAFQGDHFIFSTEDGTLAGWQSGTAALLRVDNTAANAIYKGLALMTQNAVSRLYATDFHNGKVDVFDQTYAKITAAGGFTDANLPTGFAPFGIQAIGTTIYVTYAKQDDMKEDDMSGAGNGYVDAFDFDGHLAKRVISQGALNSPWAIALAPSDFGAFSGALLVGNFGDGHIGAYNATTGVFLGAALTTAGAPLAIEGLWALVFGNDTAGAPHNRLFFTAGPHDEEHGLLGHLDLP